MNISRNRSILTALLFGLLLLVAAGCAGTAPAAESTAPAATAQVTTEAATVEATSAATDTSAAAATDSPLAVPTADMAATPTTTAGATPDVTASPAVTSTASTTGTTGINEVTFTAVEFSFDAPDTLPAGWTRITLANEGERPHDLMLLKPEAGKTISDVLSALQSEGPPDWVELFGGVSAEPGKSASYTVNLDAGNYIAISFGQNEDGPPDAAQGMHHTFTVTGEGAELSEDQLPAADATVNMIDFAFAITGTLSSGEQTIHVMNTGKALHEMQVFRLNEGVTFEQFQGLLDQEPAEGQEPPFTYVGGPVMSPGVDAYVNMTLEPGTHVLVCFIPAPEHGGQPHYKLGMIMQVEVE